MEKSVIVIWDDEADIRLRSTVEQFINAWEDFAYGYDSDACDAICEVLDDIDIKYEVQESDI